MTEPSAVNQPRRSTGIPLGAWSGSDATERLRETIIDLNNTTKRQATVMICLTGVLVVLTVVLVVLTVVLAVDK